MDLAAPHAGFVLAAYGLSALVLSGLALIVLLRDRRLARALRDLEARAAPRRPRDLKP